MKFLKENACITRFAIIGVVVFLSGVGFIYSGFYPMGADVPHNKLTYWVLETLRENSIARASKDIQVPDNLEDSDRLLAGGADYNEMCSGCHLKPGRVQSDFTLGLYPAPPNLTKSHGSHKHDDVISQSTHNQDLNQEQDKRMFWIIKHGIKASGMPSWSPGHSDGRIWDMVAFLKELPNLTPVEYQILTARGDNDAGHH